MILWIFFILGSFLVNLHFIYENNHLIIKEASRSFFEEILTTRAWNASLGGIYAPVTGNVKPNEYLIDPKRDLITTEGMHLTKINPAFMTRQIAELARKKVNVQYHITSLNPIRPANKPDAWEIQALRSFGKGKKEAFDLVRNDSIKVFRYMAPLFTDQSCLRCHAKQGYKLGEVRGGISVTMQSERYYSAIQNQILIVGLLHLFLLLAGAGGILLFKRLIESQFKLILRQNDELQKLIHTKDTLFSLVAHDLKSPLSGALGLGEIVKTEGSKMPVSELIHINNLILNSTKKTYQLSEQLVTWYRAQQGLGDFEPKSLSLEIMVSSCIEMVSIKAAEKEISITNHVPPGFAGRVDENMTASIFRNLIGNALKFTPRGGSIEISAGKSAHPGFLEIMVRDNGIGMTPEICNALMIYDFQNPKAGTENESGTGIGLTLCKEFIKRHNGEFRIESEPGKGSTFIFTLPEGKP